MLRWIHGVYAWVRDPTNHNAIIAGFTALIFVATSAYAVIALYQWEEMRYTAQTAHDSLVLSERPWVSADIVDPSPLYFSDQGLFFQFRLKLRNVGHSLARDITIWPVVDLKQQPKKAAQEACSRARTEATDARYLLFPGQELTTPTTIPVRASVKEMDEAGQLLHVQGGAVLVNVIFCIDYATVIDPSHHQTGQTRNLYRVDERGRLLGGFYASHGAYSDILLVPETGGDWAN